MTKLSLHKKISSLVLLASLAAIPTLNASAGPGPFLKNHHYPGETSYTEFATGGNVLAIAAARGRGPAGEFHTGPTDTGLPHIVIGAHGTESWESKRIEPGRPGVVNHLATGGIVQVSVSARGGHGFAEERQIVAVAETDLPRPENFGDMSRLAEDTKQRQEALHTSSAIAAHFWKEPKNLTLLVLGAGDGRAIDVVDLLSKDLHGFDGFNQEDKADFWLEQGLLLLYPAELDSLLHDPEWVDANRDLVEEVRPYVGIGKQVVFLDLLKDENSGFFIDGLLKSTKYAQYRVRRPGLVARFEQLAGLKNLHRLILDKDWVAQNPTRTAKILALLNSTDYRAITLRLLEDQDLGLWRDDHPDLVETLFKLSTQEEAPQEATPVEPAAQTDDGSRTASATPGVTA
jgi:hypothetical protein